MIATKAAIADVLILEPKLHGDGRGLSHGVAKQARRAESAQVQ